MIRNLVQPEHNNEAVKSGADFLFKWSRLGEFVDVYVDHDLPKNKCGRSGTGSNSMKEQIASKVEVKVV